LLFKKKIKESINLPQDLINLVLKKFKLKTSFLKYGFPKIKKFKLKKKILSRQVSKLTHIEVNLFKLKNPVLERLL
jgi:hypothetical protein